jgi:hypothetical protein
MSLVFRTDQTTPLTNDQVDNNFKYLRDQINLKHNISDFTSANISLKLRTTAQGQSSYELAQANAINAWSVRDLEPFSGMPLTVAKDSLVARNTSGDIYVGTVHGNLNGNATTSTTATSAGKLTTAININGVSFDGSASITIADSTKVPLAGGTMTGKLNLVNLTYHFAPINLGAAIPDENAKVNGDLWVTSSGLFFHVGNTTYQSAPLASPTFTGLVKAPGYTGAEDQVITLSHLANTATTLTAAINTKANIDSAGLTGVPTAPTATAGTNTTQLATTAFVKAAVDAKAVDVIAADKAYTDTSVITLSNSINTLLAAKAALASPVFTGTPTAPTAAAGNNSTQIANTAFITNALTTMQANINAAVAALNDAIASTRPVPAGSVFYIAGVTVPYGYFEANGQVVLQSTYHDLWVALGSPATTNGDAVGTFRIPDLRGEFIRAWDHERGIDAGRTIRSIQNSQNLEHNHEMLWTWYDGGAGRGLVDPVNPYDVNTSSETAASTGKTGYGTTYSGTNESRPRNVALMPIIKW